MHRSYRYFGRQLAFIADRRGHIRYRKNGSYNDKTIPGLRAHIDALLTPQ